MRVDGKVALVTGAYRGMGRACAELLAAEGAEVWAGDILEGAEFDSDRIRSVRMDVAQLEDWESIADSIASENRGLDILVSAAGILGDPTGPTDFDLEVYERTVAVNQNGVLFGMRVAIPLMQTSGGGSIVNFSSVSGSVGGERYTAYQASKGAVTLLTQNAAITHARDGIRVNSVHPAAIDTLMTSADVGPLSEQDTAAFIEATPLGRLGEPEEVARAVLFLASDEASYITGIQLPVDGGYLAQ